MTAAGNGYTWRVVVINAFTRLVFTQKVGRLEREPSRLLPWRDVGSERKQTREYLAGRRRLAVGRGSANTGPSYPFSMTSNSCARCEGTAHDFSGSGSDPLPPDSLVACSVRS